MLIKLSNILSNPYRVFNLNPINEQKVEKLMESIEETGLWKIIVRPSPTVEGKYELAFGHHRYEAAKRAGLEEADFDVQDLSNEQMIKMLARDNDEVYNSSMLSIVETVAATVKGLADGSLKPLEVPEKTKDEYIRYAPSFVPGAVSHCDTDVPYTPVAVGKLLGYTKKGGSTGERAADSVDVALDALYLVQIGKLKLERIANFTSAREISSVTRPLLLKVNEERIREKAQAKQEAERLRIEQEQKAFLQEQQAKVETERAKIAELEAKKREARQAENEAREKELEERIAKRKVKEAERKELIKRELPKFEEKFEKAKAAAKVSDKEIEAQRTSRQAAVTASTLIGKFERLSGKLTAINTKKQLTYKEAPTPQFLEEVSKAARNRDITANDRELLRQAMVAVGDWFIENSNLFLPIKKVDVLKEAHLKEEAKRSSSKKEKE